MPVSAERNQRRVTSPKLSIASIIRMELAPSSGLRHLKWQWYYTPSKRR